jgi:hypothetical protein
LLVHDHELLAVIDDWLIGLTAAEFTDVLPLVRRTFSAFDTGVKRNISRAVATVGSSTAGVGAEHDFAIDVDRALPAVAAAAAIFTASIFTRGDGRVR